MKFGVCCPEHREDCIGLIDDSEIGTSVGYWCRRCREHKKFNDANIKKYLIPTPEKYKQKTKHSQRQHAPECALPDLALLENREI